MWTLLGQLHCQQENPQWYKGGHILLLQFGYGKRCYFLFFFFFFSFFFRSDLFSFLQEFSFASIINPHTEAGLILLSLFRSSLRHFSASSLLRFIASLLQRCVASSLYYYIVASLLQHYVASSPCYCIVASSLQHCVASSPCNPYLFATAWLTYPSVAVLLHDRHFTIV